MCTAPKIPKATPPAAAPAAPIATAERFKMNERPTSRDGSVKGNTARSRRTLRTDVKVAGKAGPNIARMG